MDVEQAVVGVDNVLAVNEQAEVAFIRGDVQRANRHHVVFLLPSSLINS